MLFRSQLSLKSEISSELGSLAYISKVLDVSMDKVVNVLIILFIIVFDPLAICMVLAFNFMNDKKTKETNTVTKEDPIIVHEVQEVPKEPIFEQPNDNSFNFFLNNDDELAENIPVQPSEQPREQSVQEHLDPKPKLSQAELKELQKDKIRKKVEQDRLKKERKDIYNEDQTKDRKSTRLNSSHT